MTKFPASIVDKVGCSAVVSEEQPSAIFFDQSVGPSLLSARVLPFLVREVSGRDVVHHGDVPLNDNGYRRFLVVVGFRCRGKVGLKFPRRSFTAGKVLAIACFRIERNFSGAEVL